MKPSRRFAAALTTCQLCTCIPLWGTVSVHRPLDISPNDTNTLHLARHEVSEDFLLSHPIGTDPGQRHQFTVPPRMDSTQHRFDHTSYKQHGLILSSATTGASGILELR